MTRDTFELHERLANDCRSIGDLRLCRALLMNDRRFPWLVLVPRLAGLRELHDVPSARRAALMVDIEAASRVIIERFGITKINVGALGNLVPQLHVHVVGRTPADAAWPGPVWGSGPAEPYEQAVADDLVAGLRQRLGL